MEEDSNNKDNTTGTDQQYQKAVSYADNLSIQLRKGFIAYCVLVICAQRPHYTGDIIKVLREAEMVVVEFCRPSRDCPDSSCQGSRS